MGPAPLKYILMCVCVLYISPAIKAAVKVLFCLGSVRVFVGFGAICFAADSFNSFLSFAANCTSQQLI